MDINNNPAIVVPCYKKIKSLRRLLSSLRNAYYPENVRLVFSVDFSGEDDVKDCVETFEWPFGEKEVILHEKNIGLRENILMCGGLSHKYGSVIILEDDTYVSRDFYSYAVRAKDFYKDDPCVAGISLYAYEYSEIALEKFYPVYDGKDTFFMQWASSRGQLWTSDQWGSFYSWYQKNMSRDLSIFNIPQNVTNWPESSWKKYYIAYLVDTDRYFVYPYFSLVSNCGDAGFHCGEGGFVDKQVAIPLSFDISKMNFAGSDSLLKYDSFFQVEQGFLKKNTELNKFDFDVDLSGTKEINDFKKDFILSSRKCKNPILSFDNILIPFPMSVVQNVVGSYFSLGRIEDFEFSNDIQFDVFQSYVNREILSGKKCLKVVFTKLLSKLNF